jgi:hypothetical protein
MKTICEGIEFRSRTEAAWYLMFKRYCLDPVYEPETFSLETREGKTFWYMPDFQIRLFRQRAMVEIKAGIEGESMDIAKACILGYKVPTLIIVGWPLKYAAILIEERHKGNPYGREIGFSGNEVYQGESVGLCMSYPDEDFLEIDPCDMGHFAPKQEPAVGSRAYRIAVDCWNATKWNR